MRGNDFSIRKGLYASLLSSLRSPEFWTYSTWLEIVTRYRGSWLGIIWLSLPVAIFVTVLGNVYAHLMGYALVDYIPYLAVGYAVWRLILQVVNDSVGTFSQHKAFIMDGRVRLTDFLLCSFAKAGVHFGFAMLVVIAALLWSQGWIGLVHLATMLVTLPVVLVNLFWISACIALVGSRFVDIRDMIGSILIIGFLLTPILWTTDRFPPDTLRGSLVRFNPAFHLIEVVRAPALGQMPETSSIIVTLVMAVLGCGFASLIYRRYGRFVPLWV